MCRHIVMVLPYCASCDAMEKLIKYVRKLSATKEDPSLMTEEEFFELSREWAARVVDFDLQPIEH